MKSIVAFVSCAVRTVLLGAALVLASTANAVTKTYNQYGSAEVQNIEMDGLSSSTEITSTPQLAFPGVTLDDIYGCQFLTELYGGGVDTRATAWGIFPHRHSTDGSIDKMCLQFGVKDGTYSKFVILVLTNGDGGVYVQKYGWCYKSGMCLRYRFNNMDGSGNITFNGGDGNPDGSDTSGGYQAWGIRIHGIMPSANEARLVFPGATLASLTNAIFVAGLHVGGGTDNPNYGEIAECVTPWPSSDDVQKIVMQFRNTAHSNRAAVLELTQGDDGVYAQQKWAKNNAGATFTLDENGNVDGSYFSTSGEWGSYCVWELYGMPGYSYLASSAPMLLWTKKGGVLTLNDLAGASFTALFGGASVNSDGLASLTGDTLVAGLNTRETVDANGDITEIVTEFQYKDGSNVKGVVVKFTNGDDGVYGQALKAIYSPGGTLGHVLSDANGNSYYASGGSVQGVATSRTAGGYGVCDLKAIADTARIYRQGQTLTLGVIDETTPTDGTMVPYDSAAVAFSGMTLEELAGRVFFAYHGGTAVDSPGYELAAHPTLYPTTGDATKLVTQFLTVESYWRKTAILELAYNANGAVTVQKIHKTWNASGDKSTCYFSMDEDGNLSYTGNNGTGGGYDVYGLQSFPGFVQTSPTLLFKNATLNDIENATFTARMAGAWLPVSASRYEGYNKHVAKDANGDVSSIVVEFQYQDGGTAKTVVVQFTNGDGDVYGTSIQICWAGATVGHPFVTYDDDGNISGYNDNHNDTDIAVSPITGGYGVYDVQAAVEPDANEWVLDQDRSWSYYTDGEAIDDDTATIRIKVTGDNATLTIDENATVGKIVFVNAGGAEASTNAVVVNSGVSASIGEIEIGKGANVSLPTAFASAATTLGSGARVAYSGDGTASGVIGGDGGVEVLSGRVTFTAANGFTGGFVVRSGAVAVAGMTPGRDATTGPFGAIDGGVTVEAGGMVDINGHNGLSYRYTLAGNGVAASGVEAPGPIVNLGGALDIGRTTYGEWTTGHAREFTLASDVTLGAAGYDFGVVSYSTYELAREECYLGLGNPGYTLTKAGGGTLWLWASQVSVAGNGTLSIQEGVVDVRKGKYVGTSSGVEIGENGTLRVGSQVDVGRIVNDGRIEIAPRYNNYSYSGSTLNGAYSGSGDVEVLSGGILTIADSLSVADFVNNGTVNGGGTLTVGGTLTPGNAIPNLTLAAGATVKLTGLNAPQAVADTFAAAGRVYVDVSALDAETLKATDNVPVLTAPSFPADFKRNLATVGANDRGFRIVTEEGVSTVYSTRQIGFTIFVR